MTREDLTNKAIDKLNRVKEALELISLLEYDECIAVLNGTRRNRMKHIRRNGTTSSFRCTH